MNRMPWGIVACLTMWACADGSGLSRTTSALATDRIDVKVEWQRLNFGTGIGAGGIRAGDLQGNGQVQMVITAGTGGEAVYWYVLKRTSTGFAKDWESPISPDPIRSLRLAQVDADPALEILVGTGNRILVYDGATHLLERTITTSAAEIRGLTVADVDSDGALELVFCDANDLYVLDLGTGNEELRGAGLGGWDVAVGQVDLDPNLEIVVGSDATAGTVVDGRTHAVDRLASLPFGHPVRTGDVDGDGRDEVIAGFSDHVSVYDVETASEKYRIPANYLLALRVADVEGDGPLEILYSDWWFGELHVVNGATGVEKWLDFNVPRYVDDIWVADVDGDSTAEVLAGGRDEFGPAYLSVLDSVTHLPKWTSSDLVGPFTGMAAADVDADGRPELLVGSYASLNWLRYDGQYLVLDAQTKASEYQGPTQNGWADGLSRIRTANVDADPAQEICLSSASGYTTVACYDGATHAEQWHAAASPGLAYASMQIADIDLDGQLEIVTGPKAVDSRGVDTRVAIYNAATGALEQQISTSIPNFWVGVTMMRIANVDGDPQPEIVVAQDNGPLRVLDAVTGTSQLATADLGITALDTPDRDGNGRAEIVVGTAGGAIEVLDPATGAVAQTIGNYGGWINGLAVADLTGDGVPDYTFAVADRLHVINGATLADEWTSQVIGFGVGANDGLMVADVDGDGRMEIVANLGQNGVIEYQVVVDHCPGQPDGTACDDGDACTRTDACLGGRCTGSNPVLCTALDPCHEIGTCNMSTGTCSNPTQADGTACGGGACNAGTCRPRPDGGSPGDGGFPADGGSTTPDGGTVADGGSTGDGGSVEDAGSIPDGGDSLPPEHPGCGCGSTGAPQAVASLVLGLLLPLARRRRRAGLALASLVLFAACPPAPPPAPTPDLTKSEISVDRPTGAIADGVDRVQVRVTIRDGDSQPMAGIPVQLSSTGTGNALIQPAAPTDATGVATGTLSTTVAEAKTISASIAEGTLTPRAAVTFSAPSPDVTGVLFLHYVLEDGSVVDRPDDLTGRTIAAYVPDGAGSYTVIPASITGPGTFVIPNVPFGPYELRYLTYLFETNARAVDLGFVEFGRPDVARADAGTYQTNHFTNLTPWSDDPSQGEHIEMSSAGANIYSYPLEEFANPPVQLYPGDRYLDERTSYDAIARIGFPPVLVDASKGDRTYFTQLTLRDTGVYTYHAVSSAAGPLALTVLDGQDTSVSTGFSPVPQRELALTWSIDFRTPGSFDSMRTAVHPSAELYSHGLTLFALPTAAYGFVGAPFPPVLLEAGPPPGDQLFRFQYGNPFPASWATVASTGSDWLLQLPVPRSGVTDGGTLSTYETGLVGGADELSTFPTSPLRPQVGPVTGPRVDGNDFFANQMLAGTTPTFQWSPPAVGTPTHYVVTIRKLSAGPTSGFVAKQTVLRIYTRQTEARVPPGFLLPGSSYHVRIRASLRPGFPLEAAPFTGGLPSYYADAMSGLLATP